MKPKQRMKARTDRPTLPELDQTQKSVLNSLTSMQSRRSYQHAMDEFVEWYCSEPRLALNRAVVLRYRLQLEVKKLAASTIHVRLAAVRRSAYEAADTGLLRPNSSPATDRYIGCKQDLTRAVNDRLPFLGGACRYRRPVATAKRIYHHGTSNCGPCGCGWGGRHFEIWLGQQYSIATTALKT